MLGYDVFLVLATGRGLLSNTFMRMAFFFATLAHISMRFLPSWANVAIGWWARPKTNQ
jgi:hypothetical protein